MDVSNWPNFHLLSEISTIDENENDEITLNSTMLLIKVLRMEFY